MRIILNDGQLLGVPAGIRSYRLRLELVARARLDVPGIWYPPVPEIRAVLRTARAMHDISMRHPSLPAVM